MIPGYSRPQRKKGFTLVELSIVLVIIGLLIGGILVAQSMISTTKIQSFIRQISQFDAAISNFETTYKALPGDNDYFGAVVGAEIHGDRSITDSRAQYPDNDDTSYDAEGGRFWYDLSQMGLKNEDGNAYPNLSAGGVDINPGVNAPLAKIGKKSSVLVFYDDPHGASGITNYYYVDKFEYTGPIQKDEAIESKELLAVDAKIDDGKPVSGNVDSSGCNSGSNTYNLTLTCGTRIRLGISTGELK